MCQHLGALHSERVLEAHEERTRDAGLAGVFYAERLKNSLKYIKQYLSVSARTRDVQAEKPVDGFGGADNSLSTCPGDSEFGAGARPSSV